MENWGVQKRMPRNGDVGKTMKGISPKSFTVMLQHDPNAWRAKILPECNAQLTLSGHTHGGQFSLFGWNPANFTYSECFGMYCEDDRAIYVSSGLGGIIPFRLGQPGEIVVITLRKK
jgi:predicted MPP superfamily phosphohydrolase